MWAHRHTAAQRSCWPQGVTNDNLDPVGSIAEDTPAAQPVRNVPGQKRAYTPATESVSVNRVPVSQAG